MEQNEQKKSELGNMATATGPEELTGSDRNLMFSGKRTGYWRQAGFRQAGFRLATAGCQVGRQADRLDGWQEGRRAGLMAGRLEGGSAGWQVSRTGIKKPVAGQAF